MRITNIAVYTHDLTVTQGAYRMSHSAISTLQSTLVKITNDTGLVGWGETCPVGLVYQPQHALGAQAALAQMAEGLIGADPTKLGALHHRMDGLLTGHNYAKAALDIAAHDLTGKFFNVSVADLIGGALTDRVPSYFSVGAGTPEDTAETAAMRVAEGYRRLQLKIGGRPVEEDIAVIRAVRQRIGDQVPVAVDANRGMLIRDVIQLSHQYQDIPLILEQPCNTLEENIAVRERVRHPVYLDEATENTSVVLHTVGQQLCDGFGMKITRVGGIRPMSLVRDICQIRSMPHTVDDSWGGDIIAAACVQVGATIRPDLFEGTWIAEPFIGPSYDPHSPVRVVNGFIPVPERPGLGVLPDDDVLGPPIAEFA